MVVLCNSLTEAKLAAEVLGLRCSVLFRYPSLIISKLPKKIHIQYNPPPPLLRNKTLTFFEIVLLLAIQQYKLIKEHNVLSGFIRISCGTFFCNFLVSN